METAELTKTEQTHVSRMAESFKEPTMAERFEEWAGRVTSHGKQETKERQKGNGSREVKLADREENERVWIEKVGKNDEAKASPKESPRESSAEKETTDRIEQRPDARATEKPEASGSDDSPGEPLSGDLAERHWQGKLQRPEVEKHIGHVSSRAGIILKYIENHAEKEGITQGFRALMAGRPQGPNEPGFFRDLTAALAEVPNPGEVFHHITVNAKDRNFLRSVKTPKELRDAIQTVSKAYPVAKSSKAQAQPKPRAPKPPSEVTGRSSAHGDGTREADGFTDFSQRMQRRYAEAR